MKKLFWKGRKVKNNLVFRIKAFLHKRRDKLAVNPIIEYSLISGIV